ncbi:hypothetical protein [Achromobacter mucicolens]|uniref:hypothetical protein n=1 Tax=Achromobacter mucicolens TaxID=1389922 RepID=UPI0022F3AF69|nr:hypothetical protein [Achromobacter mucicolens]WBX90177.1 hypothetical protein PE062_05980 [Achromobacter mucicolens]
MRCKGLAGRLFSHDFRPVFDSAAAVDTAAVGTTPPKAKALVAGPSRDSSNVVGAAPLMGDRFYIGHVCVRCGYKIIKEL